MFGLHVHLHGPFELLALFGAAKQGGSMIEALQLKTLAELLEEQGDYVSAEPLFRKSLAVKESLFGSEHEELADDLFNLGLLCFALDKFDEAESFLLRAWSIERRYKGTMNESSMRIFEMINEVHNEVHNASTLAARKLPLLRMPSAFAVAESRFN